MHEQALLQQLGDDGVTYDDGQFDNFEITFRRVYDADHYQYYEGVPRYV